MTGSSRWCGFLLLLMAVPAWAGSRVVYQAGYAYNANRESYHPLTYGAGYKQLPQIDKQQVYLGIEFLRDVNERWALGVGAHLMAGSWPPERSRDMWSLDLATVEYRQTERITWRGSFGVVRAYNNKPATGRDFGGQFLYSLRPNLSIGLGVLHGSLDQEEGNDINGIDMGGGSADAYYLFLEWR